MKLIYRKKSKIKTGDIHLQDLIFRKQNKEARKYWYIIKFLAFALIIIYILLMTYLKDKQIIHFGHFHWKILLHTAEGFFFDTIGLIILSIVFLMKKIRRFIIDILHLKRIRKGSTIHDTIKTAFRLFITVFFALVLIFIPGIFKYYFFGYDSTILTTKGIGIIISILFLANLSIYLGNLLPDLLMFKIGKKENSLYKYIYSIYFLKSRILESPVIYIVITPILLILMIIIVRDFIYDIDLKYITPIGGIFVTLTITLAADFLRAYTKLEQVYNDYTNHLIKNKLVLISKFKIVQLGYGKVGATTMNNLIVDYLYFYKNNIITKRKPSPSIDFEIIIDRDFDLKLLFRTYLVLEKDIKKFEETFSDSATNFNYGFLHNTYFYGNENIAGFDLKFFKIPGIVADGLNIGLWKLLRFAQDPIIINATSNSELAYFLNKLVKSNKVVMPKPHIITTVDNEILENQLYSDNLNCYPINYSFYTAKSLIHRLCLVISKMPKNKLKSTNLFIYCEKTMTNDLVNTLISNLQIIYSPSVITALKENTYLSIIGTEDSTKVTSYNYLKFMMNTKILQVKEYGQILDYIEINKSFFSIAKDKKDERIIFLILADDHISSFNLLNEYVYLKSNLGLSNATVITSISEDFEEEAKKILSAENNGYQNKRIFPSSHDDLIMKKNLTIGNHVSSLVSAFTNDVTHKEVAYFKNESKLTQIEVCTGNEPFGIIKLISLLKGFTYNYNLTDKEVVIPYFHFNYSYPFIGTRSEHGSFVFRADFSLITILSEDINTSKFINGLIINPTGSLNELIEPLNNIKLDNYCSQCANCALAPHKEFKVNNCNQPSYKHSKLGYIKVVSKYRNNPITMLKILELLYSGYINDFKSIDDNRFNIVYETGSICPSTGKYLHRLYGYPKNSNAEIDSKLEIEELKILFTSSKDIQWKAYKTNLESFIDNYNYSEKKIGSTEIHYKNIKNKS